MRTAHFIGICGTGMSAVAKLLQDEGVRVSGSDDAFYPPVSDYLIAHNIPYHNGYAAANIPTDADVIVIGKHARLVPEENEEVRAAFASGIPIRSYPEILRELTRETTNYVTVGSFGKSTCTSLAAWVLLHAGKDPGFMVGALSPSLLDNARLGKPGGLFVLEGDEYPSANWDNTSKFMYFNSRHLLITSCEHDHVNVFPTLGDYLKPFEDLVQEPSIKTIVACLDGANVPEVVALAKAPVTTYSLARIDADWCAESVRRNGAWTSFELMSYGARLCSVRSLLLGEHNVQNVVGVGAFLIGTGAVTPDEFVAGIESFQGVRRRLELRTTQSRVPLYEDFGSSRPKLLAGIRAVRDQYPRHRLHVVFEPHTFSFRNRAALPWYDDLFADADEVFIFAPPIHGAATHEQLTQQEIVARVAATGRHVFPVSNKEELRERLQASVVADESVVLVETSGNVGGSVPYLVEWLEGVYV